MENKYNIDYSAIKLKILLVDDIPFQLSEIIHNLKSLGHRFVDVDSPLKAVDLVKNEDVYDPFDLVITDMRMPFMNGVDLAKGIHRLKPDLPVAMLTVENDEKEMLKIARQVELVDYITKDESLESLEFSLSNILADKIEKMKQKK